MRSMKHSVATLRVLRNNTRGFSTVKLPDLPYDYSALEPVISGKIMELHHAKHHQTYVNGYNQALEQYHQAEEKKDHGKMIALQPALKFHGGGHINHSIFWTNLTPKDQATEPMGSLHEAISKEFGSLEAFKQLFNTKTVAIQGSGWGWLGYCKQQKRLVISTLPNQDPLATTGLVPLLGIDVWEHAYYLQYKNVRADYLKSIWQIINWKNVQERFQAAQA
uniref:Superoxide dismutase n=1 Tax=Albugo laibachii Nc14 TaxID=890382 RepID=F0X0T4_9STRA|nr:superoxide dismutase putative [Albugo laibachii Nc14]|eukprot:CCA27378.1 superoxide dismutase putative [Albugo laibachii Nc14]